MALRYLRNLFIGKKSEELRLFNTLSGRTETFSPNPKHPQEVTMYNCGPTVYDYVHVGNLRSYVFADTLKRVLEYNGYHVKQVVNITDVGHLSSDADDGEDKMTKALKREGKPMTLEAMREVADFYTDRFKEDLVALNIDPSPITFPKASEHVPEQLAMIKELETKGFTYVTSDGVYFDTLSFPTYGKLGKVNMDSGEGHARVAQNSEKHNFRDFALWKFNPNLGWDSPWGKGFPGWHIECSAMSMKYLGIPIDIHTGGMDHIPIHHNNEIAQSEAATGITPFVRYWLHNEFIRLDGGKMSKSAGGFIRLQDVLARKITPLAYRYWLLNATYHTPTTLSWESLHGIQNGFERLHQIADLQKKAASHSSSGKVIAKEKARFLYTVNNNLNTPSALAVLRHALGSSSFSDADKLATLADFDRVLGLDLINQARKINEANAAKNVPAHVLKLVEARDQARTQKDWKRSDEIRDELTKEGYEATDSPHGTILKKK